MEITTTSLSHFGLVSGIFDELGIADVELKVCTESDNEVGVFPVQRDYRINNYT